MKWQEKLNRFIDRLDKCGIQVKLSANYPWIYLDEINGKRVSETFMANQGFTIMFVPIKGDTSDFTDISEIMKLIRKYTI
jgi:hypothetical protein